MRIPSVWGLTKFFFGMFWEGLFSRDVLMPSAVKQGNWEDQRVRAIIRRRAWARIKVLKNSADHGFFNEACAHVALQAFSNKVVKLEAPFGGMTYWGALTKTFAVSACLTELAERIKLAQSFAEKNGGKVCFGVIADEVKFGLTQANGLDRLSALVVETVLIALLDQLQMTSTHDGGHPFDHGQEAVEFTVKQFNLLAEDIIKNCRGELVEEIKDEASPSNNVVSMVR